MHPSDGQTIFQVDGLNVKFSGNHVVKNITLSVKRGETLGVIGSTGSGKTLTILSALGLVDESAELTNDKVLFLNQPLSKDLFPKKVAVVFQNASMSLNPIKKSGKQIERILRKQKQIKKDAAKTQVLKLFDQVGLSDIERIYHSYPHELSGGEKQRVMIAMGLSCSPDLLILDEPLASLDKIIQLKIIDLLVKIKESATLTLIIISHDLKMISRIADRILHINQGRKIAEQETKELFTNPEHEVTRNLVAELMNMESGEYNRVEESIPLITISEVSKEYSNGKKALIDINLTINDNEILGIVGESGSGKSTLAKCIKGIATLSSGSIDSKLSHEDIAFIFQDGYNSVDPYLTIAEVLQEVLRLQENPQSVEELLELVSLDKDVLHKKIGQLSGGQRQRVNLARGLAQNPKVLICDEITSGLDLEVQIKIVELMINKFSHLSIIFISHDISLVRHFCQRVAIMKNGKIVELAETQEIFEKSTHEYTRELINSAPRVKYFLNM